ncbi:YihY/virulence factor BrkB family protein [Deinococcus antarcticus]|uniref:YihY/virulence factor BrkB family protein n=1 Tax=Deinococcus antarcticus TaxID=1298767 RepID=A0ABV8A1D6_9DEIO
MRRAAFKPADLFTLIKEAALAFGQDKAPRLAAALSYYAMLSLSPLLLLAAAVLGRYLTDPAILNSLFGSNGVVTQNLGEKAAEFLREQIPTNSTLLKGSLIATIIGLITLFMGSTGLFVQLQDALNSMWGADPAPKQTILQMIKTRLISFLMILFIGAILLVFLGANTYLSAVASHLGERFGVGAFFVRIVTLLLSTLFLTPVFAFIFKFLPTIKLEWKETWVGAAVTAFLFTIGQILISIYLGRTAPGSALGASAALVALLIWIYYSGMIFFFGAEVTWVYSQKFGSHAGGVANTAKKEALNAQGAQISTAPSLQEKHQAAQVGQDGQSAPIRDSRGRVIGLPGQTGATLTRPAVPAQPQLPSLGGTLWNALSAVLAIPAVIVLKLVGLAGKKTKS